MSQVLTMVSRLSVPENPGASGWVRHTLTWTRPDVTRGKNANRSIGLKMVHRIWGVLQLLITLEFIYLLYNSQSRMSRTTMRR